MYRKVRELDGLEQVSYKTNARPQSGSALTPYRVMDLYTPSDAAPLTATHLRRAVLALCVRHLLLRCRVVITGPPPAPTPKARSKLSANSLPPTPTASLVSGAPDSAPPTPSATSSAAASFGYFEEDLRFASLPTTPEDSSALESLVPLELHTVPTDSELSAARKSAVLRIMNSSVPFPTQFAPLIRLIWIRSTQHSSAFATVASSAAASASTGESSVLIVGLPHLICDGLCLAPLMHELFLHLHSLRTHNVPDSTLLTPPASAGAYSVGLPQAFRMSSETKSESKDNALLAELCALEAAVLKSVVTDPATQYLSIAVCLLVVCSALLLLHYGLICVSFL
jgi:hypothetical protein